MNESVLVEVWIPAAYFSKDMYLSLDMPIQMILELIKKLLQDLCINYFVIQPETRLYRQYPFQEFSLDATLRDYHVLNTETFILM